MKLVYTAISKRNFYFRQHISKFVLDKNCVPLNPFMLFDYFLLDSVDRDLIREANNTLIKKADELWVFGSVSDGVLYEIELAKALKKPVRYFKIVNSQEIEEISDKEVEYEEVSEDGCEEK